MNKFELLILDSTCLLIYASLNFTIQLCDLFVLLLNYFQLDNSINFEKIKVREREREKIIYDQIRNCMIEQWRILFISFIIIISIFLPYFLFKKRKRKIHIYVQIKGWRQLVQVIEKGLIISLTSSFIIEDAHFYSTEKSCHFQH